MIPVRYTTFAILATGANLLTQFIFLFLYHGIFHLYLAIAAGTLMGLVIKYILDKKYIFRFKASGRKEEGWKFVLYALTGAFTTVLFWGTELFFDFYFQTSVAKYLGGLAGLAMGYTLKYFLDKKLVFKRAQ